MNWKNVICIIIVIVVVVLFGWLFFYFSDDICGYKFVDILVVIIQINGDNVKSVQIDDCE